MHGTSLQGQYQFRRHRLPGTNVKIDSEPCINEICSLGKRRDDECANEAFKISKTPKRGTPVVFSGLQLHSTTYETSTVAAYSLQSLPSLGILRRNECCQSIAFHFDCPNIHPHSKHPFNTLALTWRTVYFA